jgi:hypothetical protein
MARGGRRAPVGEVFAGLSSCPVYAPSSTAIAHEAATAVDPAIRPGVA